MSDKSVVQIEVISSPHQNGLYINGYRVAGGKPWGGGATIDQWNVDIDDLRSAGFVAAAEVRAIKEERDRLREAIVCWYVTHTEAANKYQRGAFDLEPKRIAQKAIADAYQRGQEDMRERLASWLMCGCDTLEQARVVAAATTDGPNSGARWRACHRSDCLALIAAEALETPIKEAPHE